MGFKTKIKFDVVVGPKRRAREGGADRAHPRLARGEDEVGTAVHHHLDTAKERVGRGSDRVGGGGIP